jgi:hypothetical protein
MNPTQPPLPLTLANGEALPPPPGEEYREHTAERWRDPVRGDPLSYDYCIYLIRELGITNRSELERQVDAHRKERGLGGVSRNSIIALINDTTVFKPGEINQIIARSSALLTMESIGASRDLVEKAKSTKDLGAVAMVMTAAHNIKQIQSGGPTEIKAVHHRFSVDDFEKVKAAAQGKVIEVETLKTPPPLPEAVLETVLTPLTPVKAKA